MDRKDGFSLDTFRSFIHDLILDSFSCLAPGSGMDLYEVMKRLSRRTLLSIFISSPDTEEELQKAAGIEPLQEDKQLLSLDALRVVLWPFLVLSRKGDPGSHLSPSECPFPVLYQIPEGFQQSHKHNKPGWD